MAAIPEPGDTAPEITLDAADESTFRLSDHRGHPVVLFFFPKAATPG